MTGMAAWGSMVAVAAGGGRIAVERSVGWNASDARHPLSTYAYFQAKVLSGYLMAALSIVLLYVAGASYGVRLSALSWLTMTGLILVGLVPFAVMGIILGHLLTADSMGPALGGATSIFAILGGAWGPIFNHGALESAVQYLPSYWLVQAESSPSITRWPAKAWIVVAVWSVALVRIAIRVYRRDTGRV